jgi:L-lactate dehydrogenase (cytochrome)
VLRDVTNGSTETEFMGVKSTLPIFISPAAMAKLGHPLGEVNLTKGAGECGIVQGVSRRTVSVNAVLTPDLDQRQLQSRRDHGCAERGAEGLLPGEFCARRTKYGRCSLQIYLNKDRKASEALLKRVTDYKAAAVIFTVDTAWKSKRTRDVRAKAVVDAPIKESGDTKGGGRGSKAPLGVSQAISGYQDSNLTWDDIDFIRVSSLCGRHWDGPPDQQKNTTLPLIVKGVQCIEDVDLCAKAGVDGVILSNHGGRQCDL